jgi:SAM-dependent methyltransferase
MSVPNEYMAVWQSKAALRLVYSDFFDRISRQCGPGPTLEIGGGIGNLKEHLLELWSSDIQHSADLDLVADAQRLPFRTASLGNIVMLDVLHHLEFPLRFLRDAARVLRPQGRIVMVEPAITLGSTLFYRYLHHEAVDMSADPLREGEPDPRRDPYCSNQAIPTLIVTDHRDRFQKMVPELKIATVAWFSLWLYPLTGGFRRWSLITSEMVRAGLRVERAVEPWLGRLIGFRVLVRIERI